MIKKITFFGLFCFLATNLVFGNDSKILTPITQANIQTAVNDWMSDPAAATATYGHIKDWDVSNVTDMSGLFKSKQSFNDDISSWNVSNVTNMYDMFHDARAFNQDIGGWDVSSVTNMGFMLKYTTNFDQDLSNWCVTNISSTPTDFNSWSGISSSNLPVWGTCPSVDTTAPTITTTNVVSSVNDGETALGSVSADESVTWSITGTGVSINSSGVITLDVAADFQTANSHAFTVTATDTATNATTTGNLTVTVNDTTAPTGYAIVSLTTTVNNGNQTAVTFNISGLEANSTYNWSISDGSTSVSGNGSQANAGTANISADVTSLNDGSLTVTVYSTDSASNQGADVTATTTKDTVNPFILNISMSSNNSTSGFAMAGNEITLTFDSSESINAPWVSIAGKSATVTNSGNSWTATYTVQSTDTNGAAAYEISGISDIASNATPNESGTGSVVIDTTAPTVTVTANTVDVNLNITTNITVNDINDGSSDNISASGNLVFALDKSTFSCSDIIPGQVSTPVTVTLTVTDEAGNSATATKTVNVIDDAAPANVVLVNPNYVHPTGTGYVEQGLTYDEACFKEIVIASSDLDANQWGTYTIVYKVVDKSGNESATITRTQVVNNVPTTDAANFTVNQDTENHVFNVLDGDSFGPDGAKSFTISGPLSAQNGTLVLQDLGTTDPTDDLVIYTPKATYNGPDSFTYTIEDENGDTVTTTVNITVRPIVPVPLDDAVTVDKNSINNVIDVLNNDDFGGNNANTTHPLTFTNGSKSSATPNGGLISIEDNSTPNDLTDDVIFYSPAADFVGTDTFDYTITDVDGDATIATVTITVQPGANLSTIPSAFADVATVAFESENTVINVLNNDLPGADGYIDNGLRLTNGTTTGASTNGGLISVDTKSTASTSDDEFKYSAPTGFSGTDTFSYTITDASGDASTATVTVTVNPATPLEGAVDDAVSVALNSTDNEIDVLANDNFGTVGVGTMLINSPDHLTGTTTQGGVLTLDNGGTSGINQADDKILYTPPTNFNGVDTFDYTLTVDGNQYQGTVTITVGTVIPPATTPTANDDSVTVGYESSNNVIAVLDNDIYGSDGLNATHPLTLVNGKLSTASVEGGLISVSDNNTPNDASDDVVLYSAPAGFSGADSFEYTITDLNGDAATGTVNITVNPVPLSADPTATDDAFSVAENSNNNDLAILDNDSFGTEGAGSISLSAGSNSGTLAINENGTIGDPTDDTVTYTPVANFVGTETFTYTLTDAGSDTDTATVTITVGTVAPPATVPTAVDDAATVIAGSTDNVIDVLSNDTPGSEGYIDGGLTMTNGTLTSASTKGSAISIDNKNTADTTDDVFNYTPSAMAAANGTDTFSYTITDASGDASTATVTVTITAVVVPTDEPSAVDDTATTVQDTSVSIDVLDNDDYGTDNAASSGALTVPATSSLGGALSVIAGEVSYTPATNFVGTDTFTYTIEDGNGDTDTATVTVTVTAAVYVNGTPTAVDDSVTVGYESSNNEIALLDNDAYGSDGLNATHPLTLVNGKQSTASVEGGLISVSDNNTPNDASDDVVLYSAPAGFSGADSFEYTITDLNGDAATGTVNITVNPVPLSADPTATDDAFSVAENSNNNDLAILDNDSFGTEGAGSISLSAGSNSGTLAINENGTIGDPTDDTVTYTPVANFVGTETFTYTLTDAGSDTDTATVTITVGTVAPPATVPTAVDDAATVIAGSTDNVIDVLSNDTPGSEGYIDGGLTMTNGTLTSASTKGSAISIDNKNTADTTDDVFNYTPSAMAAANGTDTFSYTITDASGDASTATVTVTITAVVVPTDEPSAVDDTATTVQDTSVSIDVLDNDDYGTDNAASSGALTVPATSSLGGALSVIAGEVSYTPATNFVGTDTFTYTIEDGNGDTDTATVTVTVTVYVNGTPTANDDSASVVRLSTVNYIDVLDNDNFGTDGPSATHPLTLSNGRLTGTSTGGRFIEVHNNGTPNDLTDDTISYSPGSLLSDSFEYTITDGNGDATTATVFITTTASRSVPESITIGASELFVDNFMSYPNPTRGNVTTTLLSSSNTKATLFLFDTTGKVISSTNLELQEGVNLFDFNFKVKAGMLFMKIVSAEKNYGTYKIVFK